MSIFHELLCGDLLIQVAYSKTLISDSTSDNSSEDIVMKNVKVNKYDALLFLYDDGIYVRNTFDEFIIWKPGDDGYLLCCPSTSAAQTIGQLEEFIDEMQLEKGTLSVFLKYLTE